MRMRVALALLIAVVLSSCTSGATSSSPSAASSAGVATGGTLVWGKQLDMSSANVVKDGSKQSWEIYRMVYEPLTQPTKDGGVAGELAQSWDKTSPTSYLFHLRPGAKFSNGRALDSGDVVASFDSYKKDGSYYNLAGPIQAVTAVDPMTVRFDLSRPFGALPAALESFWILPGKELKDGSYNPDKDFLGTGPFMVKDHTLDVSWTFVKNPNYWRQGYPKVDEVDVKIIKDDAARVAALKAGTIDFAIFDSNDTPRLLQDVANTKVVVQGTTDWYYLTLNSLAPTSKFRDKRVRQALELALDRQQIIDTALGGLGKPTGYPSMGFPDGCDPTTVPNGKANLEQAKALLKDAGVENLTFSIVLAPSFGATLGPQMAQVFQQNLSQIGVKATISIVDGGTFVSQFRAADFDALLNWSTGGPDASASLSSPILSPTFQKSATGDQQLWQQLATEAASAQAAEPGSERTSTLQQICRQIFDDASYMPIATKPTVLAYRTDRVNLVLLPVEGVQQTFRNMDEFTRVAR